MKIVMLTSDAPNQSALAAKVAAQFNLIGIVIEKKPAVKNRKNITSVLKALTDRILFASLRKSWFGMMNFYKNKYSFPAVEKLVVSSINDQSVVNFVHRLQPDVLIVSGTGLVRHPVLSLHLPKGILNLHTGLSPYVKGGPNCTNWCLSLNQPHLIGNTVMFIDAGIDSGDIFATESTIITGDETLTDLHIKVMEHAHDLYIRCLMALKDGTVNRRVRQQSVATGHTYYTREWNFSAKWKVLINFRNYSDTVKSESFIRRRKELTVFPCDINAQ